MKKLIIIILATFSLLPAFGQQDPVVSQYMFNQLFINPGYAGNKDYIMTTLLHRSQWTGWNGAPRTQIFGVHGHLKDDVNAFGLVVSNDHIGVTNQTDFYANYAYRVKLNRHSTLGLGLKGGMSWYTAQLGKLVYWDEDDPSFNNATQTNLLPNFGFGAFFNSERFYAGLSVPHLLSYDPRQMFSVGGNIPTIPKVARHYFLTAGYAFQLNANLVMKPSVMMKYVRGARPEADLNLNFLINNRVWVGGSYRTGDAVLAMAEFLITPKLSVGYAYDYSITEIRNFSYGSHEIMLGYNFGYDVLKMKTPRFF